MRHPLLQVAEAQSETNQISEIEFFENLLYLLKISWMEVLFFFCAVTIEYEEYKKLLKLLEIITTNSNTKSINLKYNEKALSQTCTSFKIHAATQM